MSDRRAFWRFVVYSLIGLIMFFVPITIGGQTTIPIDHLLTLIHQIPYFNQVYPLLLVFVGIFLPFTTGSFKESWLNKFFAFLNLLAVPFVLFGIFNFGPPALLEENMIPFILNKVVLSVCTIVPVGSIFLAFMVSYGLMEFVGVFMRPVMKPIFKTPGRSAIDAVASFVGSYSLALLITNRVYEEGKYTDKEACIIATGFSTVSATFMIVAAKALGFFETHWLLYFFITLIITFIVTAITTRIPPLSTKADTYYQNQTGDVEEDVPTDKLKVATQIAIEKAKAAPDLWTNIKDNLKDGLVLALKMAPSLMSIGVLGLILAKYTPIFDYLGYIFLPFTWVAGLKEPLLAGQALSMSIAEMFLPVVPVTGASFVTRFTVGIVIISEILFFSASIPCMMATNIPLNIKDYVVIWFERVAISILIAGPVCYLLFTVVGI